MTEEVLWTDEILWTVSKGNKNRVTTKMMEEGEARA